MALGAEERESLRNEVEKLNQAMVCELSYKKLYSDVKKIMSKDPARQPDLFVEYYDCRLQTALKERYQNARKARSCSGKDHEQLLWRG